MPSWPSSLPTNVIAGSHRMRPNANVAAFVPDVGEPIRRRRYTGRSSSDSFTLKLTYVQTERLLEFWSHDCVQGTLSFNAPLIDGVVRKWWFDPENPPDFTNIRGGDNYEVSVTMGCKR